MFPRAAAGREPAGGRSACPGGMPSFWSPLQSQKPSLSPGAGNITLASECHPSGTHAPVAVPNRSLSQEGQVWCHPRYLLTRTARRGKDVPLSVVHHSVPSVHVCVSLRLGASPSSAGGAGSSLWGEVVAQGWLGARRTRCNLGPGAAGAEESQQLSVISTDGSAERSHVQPHLMGNGKQ